MHDLIMFLRENGIQATPQRLAVATVVLGSRTHPTADNVWQKVRKICPTASRATVYNTLNLFIEKKLVKPQFLREGTVVFDSLAGPHHHFIDEATGRIYDVPWDAVKVRLDESLEAFDIHAYQVVMRGRRRRNAPKN